MSLSIGLVLSVLTWGTGLSGWKRSVVWGALVVIAVVAARALALLILGNVDSPPEWDFMCFWTWGRMAATASDFYDPSIASAFGMGRTADFWTEILNVGFWYPPQTMLMLAPLGYLQPRMALTLWYAFHFSCALAAAFVLWRQFAKEKGVLGLLAVSTLVICFPGTRSTFEFAQTNAVGLLLSALVWQDRQRARAGVWAALCLIVKPYLAVWFVFLVVIKNWKAIGVGLLAALTICAFTGLLFGFDKFATYLLHNPMERAPLIVYTERVNQSFLATVLRATHQEAAAKATWVKALGGILAIVVLVPSLVVALKIGKQIRLQLLAGAILLMATLIVYPFALMHYNMIALPVFLLIWSMREQLPGGSVGTVVGVFALILGTAIHRGSITIWVHLALLVWLLVIALRQVGQSQCATQA